MRQSWRVGTVCKTVGFGLIEFDSLHPHKRKNMKPKVTADEMNFRKHIAKQAFKEFIGSMDKCTPEKFAQANAFCAGAKFARETKTEQIERYYK